MLAIAAKLEEQLSDIGVGAHQHDQDCVRIEHGDNGEAITVLEHGRHQHAAPHGVTEVVGGADDGRDPRREVLWIETRHALTVDQKTIAPENNGGFNSLALPDGAYEVSNARHALLQSESAAKHKGDVSEVKRRQSLEFARSGPYSPQGTHRIHLATPMLPTRPLRVALVAFAVFGVACGDPTLAKATFASGLSTTTLYALTGAPPSAPTALSFLSGASRATATFNFDVAFDLDASNRAVILPVRVVGGALAGTLKRVGLQVVPGSFSSVVEVPATGYDTLNAKTLVPGAVLAVELRDATACFSSFNLSVLTSQFIYAKLVVDSVDATTRRIFTRSVVDPNCGYRGVVPDSVPTR